MLGRDTENAAGPDEVPQAAGAEICAWLYDTEHEHEIQVSMDSCRLVALPDGEGLAELLGLAEQNGYTFLLIDGPRQQRPTWVLDPWWTEAPVLSQALIAATQARCVAVTELRAAVLERA